MSFPSKMSSRRRSRSALSAGAEADSGHSIGASDEESAAKCLRGEGARRASSAGQASDPTAPRVDGSEHGHASDSAAGEELAATGHHSPLRECSPSCQRRRAATAPNHPFQRSRKVWWTSLISDFPCKPSFSASTCNPSKKMFLQTFCFPIDLGTSVYLIYIRHIQRFYCSFIVPFIVPKTTPQLAGRIEAMIDRATSQSSRSLQPRRKFQDWRSQAQIP